MILNILLLILLFTALLHTLTSSKRADEAASLAALEAEDASAVVGAQEEEGNPELDAWIANMKDLALKHGVDAYFLQELFPEQIVYAFRGQHIYADINPALPQHSYDWQYFTTDENRAATYSDPSGLTGIWGIDVSKYQGDINWQTVKDAGVGYVILRVGYRGYETGQIMLDEYLESYLEGATAVGLPIGVYFFSQAISAEEAVEEADYVMEAIAGYDIQYPVVFDMEEVETSPNRTESLSATEITDIAIAFCNRVSEGGYHPMIYGNVSWFLSLMELERLDGYDKWFAQYRPMPYYPYEFTMWQYTHRGTVDGITGDVDMNICFVDYAALLSGGEAAEPSEPPAESAPGEEASSAIPADPAASAAAGDAPESAAA